MLAATLILAAIGGLMGAGLGWAARVFAVSSDNPLLAEIERSMPGSQCGQCGFPGCSAAAAALAEGKVAPTCCPPGGMALAERLAQLLDVPLEGGQMPAPLLASIEAEQCTGCTRCYRACPTDAIVGANGQIHAVLHNACTGCGKCLEACPEGCVSLAAQAPTLDTWHWGKPQAA
ncbi:RnfABCDGE type electron transport complex subunit B [Stutzerimonas kirkiae]|uniref:Electron transporter RnfB n=1 Tax=Stutzerimonas kirkiae TaxID=2211392 RepID=A0A4Q9RCS9_9GAMM|nr:RnfABCDGE type electron transport complex subunit B [Stutzerimonas kirkiae]TBU98806.1 electron transporter RnfB [Stutzerimonas kirkiae]TBV03900.1 electron transporter RnfB [Stutzerimonas kirkiae]TBV09686.1 electron transporter RnfB [Stutzerimonas kirkiae]TBV16780.1 electron transporter RnfB [Stutzerimonas kirkiae]